MVFGNGVKREGRGKAGACLCKAHSPEMSFPRAAYLLETVGFMKCALWSIKTDAVVGPVARRSVLRRNRRVVSAEIIQL